MTRGAAHRLPLGGVGEVSGPAELALALSLLKAVWGKIEAFFALDGVVRWVLADPQLAPPVIAPECLTRAHRFARTRRAFTTR